MNGNKNMILTLNQTDAEEIFKKHNINGWQLAKMKKSIPDMSLP